ncbi:hypothetical protein GCM10007880_58110 [Mesorhizobium amorphae]|uniref:response regulator n=1 Tax=Mesorhizobium amorphae TaxID=71433 RepID=UPI00235C076F|nr:response regulator [Mesorhizobium amorphae]GLR45294.1 hypothetical protein GCM10007880_58110 [Mesorhizobium amorphae]
MEVSQLRNRNIFIAEDEYSFACELAKTLAMAGARVIRPVDAIEDTLDFIMSSALIDGAILSVNLQGEATFVAAEHLLRRRIPFIFVVGFNSSTIPEELKDIPSFEKPVDPGQLIVAMASLIAA